MILLDIDECELKMDDCDNQTTYCFNTFGGFDCLCLSGYINPNGMSCQRKLLIKSVSFKFDIEIHLEIDECSDPSLNDCHDNANCTDVPGSYVCECVEGYQGNGTFCESMFESLHLLHALHQHFCTFRH